VDKFAFVAELEENGAFRIGKGARFVRWTVRREQAGRERWWAAAAGACLVLAVPVLAGNLPPTMARMAAARDYAVRIVLPAARNDAPLRTEPGARKPPAELSDPDVETTTPAETELAVVASPVAKAAPRARMPGVIALDYNLSGGAQAGDAIELDKPVVVAGAEAGRIVLRIDGNARVYAQGRRVVALLAARGGAVPKGIGDDFVSLEALRALGVEVRYDAARDRLILDPPKA
jgi:hypothetical protein